MAVTNTGVNTVSVSLANGDGTFAARGSTALVPFGRPTKSATMRI